jgi:hypothetical protein
MTAAIRITPTAIKNYMAPKVPQHAVETLRDLLSDLLSRAVLDDDAQVGDLYGIRLECIERAPRLPKPPKPPRGRPGRKPKATQPS